MTKFSLATILSGIALLSLYVFSLYLAVDSSTKDKSSSTTNCVSVMHDITEETTESAASKSIYEVYKENTVNLLNILKSTEYKTITVNDHSYNILGYIDDFNNRDKFKVINCMYTSFLNRDTVQYIESSKALVLLDIPVVYTNNNVTNTLDSFNVLAVINDDYRTKATITPIAIINDEGKVAGVYQENYTELADTFPVNYQQLVDKGIIEQPTVKHWSVE